MVKRCVGGNADRRGRKNPNARLDEEKVVKIRRLAKSGMTLQRIAEHYKVHRSTVGDIVSGKSWIGVN